MNTTENKTQTVWITKYALTKGIFKIVAELCGDDMVRDTEQDRYHVYYHNQGIDWHYTRESAIKRAEIMREKKIKSLEKQLKKMKEMKFE